ncbi:NLR family CARD domain-containing protein 4-like isoform X2 [Diadema antillarum]|uniref:NLR family CARD domain-containing protein 4-like isoform X2 n=1 Tax=Diadema antillarum TaxID=105358 RepID=UPI003A8443DA
MLSFTGCVVVSCSRRKRRPDKFDEEYELMLMESPLSSSLLTKEQVQQCKEDLKAYYCESLGKVRMDPFDMSGVELNKIYVDLSLINQSSEHNIPISYDDLLTNDGSENLPKRLLIYGEAGVGKSTLCAKIAWDWCQGNILQDLDMVLLVPLRDVQNVKSVGDIWTRYFSTSKTATPNNLCNYILGNQSKILLVFDGFDEFSGKLCEEDSSGIIRILGLEQYTSCNVIVTTRPWKTNEFKLNKSLRETYTFIRVDGFNMENISSYITRYFRIRDRDILAEGLISFMEENDVIRSDVAPFPIFCAMLCLMWNDFSEKRRKEMHTLQTFSHVFQKMISFLEEHCASKFCEKLQNLNVVEHVNEAGRAIEDISEIALVGLLERNLSFAEEQFKERRDAMETCCSVGVLTREMDVITWQSRRKVHSSSFVPAVSFPHKLFQEYIAGLYIGNLFTNDRPKYNELKRKLFSRYKEFRYLLYFTSALGNELGVDIINDLKRTNDQHYCVDVAFECHSEEAAGAVGERWREHILASYTSEHTKSGIVFMVHCNQVLNCGKTMSSDLAEGVSFSSMLRRVIITNSRFHTDFYKILSEKSSNCQVREIYLWFYTGWLEEPGIAADLAKFLCCIPHLECAQIECRDLPPIFFTTIALQVTDCNVESITVNRKPLREFLDIQCDKLFIETQC